MPRAGRETVEVRIQGRGDSATVPVKPMSLEGGDYLDWTADGKAVTWAWGAQFFRQPIDAAEPQKTDVVVELPRSQPKGSVLLTGARIITMKGTEVIPQGDVLVTDNRIAAVGKRGSLTVPAGTRTISVAGKTIMPGLVDAHSHMWAPRGLHQTEVWQYLANLAYGVTTTRDPQTSTPDVFAYADMVDSGMMPGPRVYATGPGVFSGSGIDSREAAFRFIKRYKEAYRTNTLKQYVAGDRIVRQWIIEACKEYGITATIEGSLDLKLNLTQMADGYSGQEHSLPIAPLYKDVTMFVAKTKTFYTPTILVAYGAPWTRELLVRDRVAGQRRQAAQVGAVGAARQHGAPPSAVVPARGVRPQPDRQGRGRRRARRRPRRPRQPRPAAGPGRALGNVEPRVGRPDAARNAAGDHDVQRRGDRPAAGRRLARGRASWRTCSCSIAIRSRTSRTPTRFAT